jgi:hypothetical protein
MKKRLPKGLPKYMYQNLDFWYHPATPERASYRVVPGSEAEWQVACRQAGHDLLRAQLRGHHVHHEVLFGSATPCASPPPPRHSYF